MIVNLSLHLSEVAITKCPELDIRFVLLPPNSTDKCQPLDVSFFGPMKREWRTSRCDDLPPHLLTSLFPGLLSKLMDRMGLWIPANLMGGFKACGITPLNMDIVLRKFPRTDETTERTRTISPALLEYLQQFKNLYSPGGNEKQRKARKRLLVELGKSIFAMDITSTSSSSRSPRPATYGATSTSAHSSTYSTTSQTTGTDSTLAHPSTSLTACQTQATLAPSPNEGPGDSASEEFSSEDEWLPPTTKKARSRNVFQEFS